MYVVIYNFSQLFINKILLSIGTYARLKVIYYNISLSA